MSIFHRTPTITPKSGNRLPTVKIPASPSMPSVRPGPACPPKGVNNLSHFHLPIKPSREALDTLGEAMKVLYMRDAELLQGGCSMTRARELMDEMVEIEISLALLHTGNDPLVYDLCRERNDYLSEVNNARYGGMF